MADDYTTITNPYDSNLARVDSGLSLVLGGSNTTSGVVQQSQTPAQAGGNTAASSSVGGGPVQQASVASGAAIADITIEHSIQSKNWSPKKVGFYIDGQTGYAEFSNVFVSGDIRALTGTIGGWTINATTISASGIILDSAGSISTSNFVSGPLGAGWSINSTGTAEFQNIITRGVIRTSVFEKDTISGVNGMVLVSKADILNADMTALDSSSLTISGETTFVANEVIRVKDGTDDEWMLVTSAASAPVYTVTRDLAGAYSSNSNPIWKKGTAVVSMGVGTGTKTGFVLIDSSSANSPYIDIYGRNSNTYTDYTLHGRYGWLKGITDSAVGLSSTDVWGLYTDNAYIKGVIVANTGYIGGTSGWVIGTNSITSGSGASTVGLDNTVTSGDDVRFYAGSATPSSAPFRVTEAGNMVVSSLERNDYHWFTVFESIDGYAKAGAGTQTLNPDHVALATTAGANSESELQKDALYSRSAFSWDKKRKIKFGVRFDQNTSQYIDMVTGQVSYGADVKHFGFRVLNGTLYGLSDSGTGESTLSLVASIATNADYELEARFTPGVSVQYYVNGTLIDTETTTLPSGSTSEAAFLMDFYIRATSASLRSLKVSYFDLWQQN